MRTLSFLSLIVAVTAVSLSCGSSSNTDPRHLQSITISQVASGQLVQFVATGTFSAPPTTVTPLPVMWGLQLYAPPPQSLDYTLTSQPYMFSCAAAMDAEAGPVSAIAPSDPVAPASGSWPFSKMTLAYATIKCP
jgi:hypothetical protein